jgi:hypothetical protein
MSQESQPALRSICSHPNPVYPYLSQRACRSSRLTWFDQSSSQDPRGQGRSNTRGPLSICELPSIEKALGHAEEICPPYVRKMLLAARRPPKTTNSRSKHQKQRCPTLHRMPSITGTSPALCASASSLPCPPQTAPCRDFCSTSPGRALSHWRSPPP